MSRCHKPCWLVLAGLVTLVPCPAPAPEPQLLNSSFEEPGGEGRLWISDRAMAWERWGAWFNRETTWAPTYDGQCLAAYHHWSIQGDDTSGLFQDIASVPTNKPYLFGIKVLRDKGTNADYVELRMEPFQGGSPFASALFRMGDLNSDKWQDISVTGVGMTPGMRVLVIVKPGRSSQRKGALKFDCARFESSTNRPGAAALLEAVRQDRRR